MQFATILSFSSLSFSTYCSRCSYTPYLFLPAHLQIIHPRFKKMLLCFSSTVSFLIAASVSPLTILVLFSSALCPDFITRVLVATPSPTIQTPMSWKGHLPQINIIHAMHGHFHLQFGDCSLLWPSYFHMWIFLSVHASWRWKCPVSV